jgi:iron complex outermembrane receptor protein
MKKNTPTSRRLKNQKRLLRYGLYLAGATLFIGSPQASDSSKNSAASAADGDIIEKPLEELLRMQITSASKKKENLSSAATAIFVITGEDIRRSGVTSIPEALRLSPGLAVARQDSHTWAVSSRGFNDEFANQLLVLIDGRSVYTPLFAGVYWDVQDMMLEDLDRIEVIRGPGATLWGANAVNGVINITSKSAYDTVGTLITGGAGSEELGFGVRYGAKLGDNGALRVYGKWFDRDDSVLPNGTEANDEWRMQRGGFRYDGKGGDKNNFTLQGDIYSGSLNQAVTPFALATVNGMPTLPKSNDDVDVAGGDVLGKWVHSFSDSSELALKVYWDHTWRDRVVFAETRDTFDLDLQHHFQIGERNDMVWGLGYNVSADKLDNRFPVSFNPDSRTTQLYSAFLQDQYSIIPDKLKFTLGTKIEHNDYTGWEFQPSGRLSYSITDKQTAWVAASRAISTPSRAEDNIRINQGAFPTGLPAGAPQALLISQFGNTAMVSKELVGFELGYRVQPLERLTADAAAFYNIYDKQRSLEGSLNPATAGFDPSYGGVLVLPSKIGNGMSGETYGFELSATYQATDWWRIRANYSFLKMDLHLEPGVTDPFGLEGAETESPVHQVGIRSLMDLPMNFEVDTGMRYVDRIKNLRRPPGFGFYVPSYLVGDVRVGWRQHKDKEKGWEVSITGQNLFDTHQEFAPSYIQTQATEVEMSVFAKVTYRF